ncbi:MAG TPA: MBL fold metallo-hydrolase [Woeseiaceae bacterium]|jgi:glyoxylase-like metal-dependent hydrolase (beta-lactamase superfamily II)|nr:MBL fold metallo-hydrolase [Woeseiaceae bacterium]
MNAFGPTLETFTELRPGIRRLVAPNPSMMTGPGTNTYLIGEDEIAVLDPGPAIDRHIENIIELAGKPIRWILATHTHPDHSPAAYKLAEITGAVMYGRPAPAGPHQDQTFVPQRFCGDGERLNEIDEFDMEAIHTPGHASNHVCYLHEESNWLFTGDHVIDGSTVVIDPPDGNMREYIESLGRIRRLGCAALAPGHGEVIRDPERVIDWIVDHRLEREAKVLAALQANPGLTTTELVPHVYADVAQRLHALAERSLLAHLEKLQEDGRATLRSGCWGPL